MEKIKITPQEFFERLQGNFGLTDVIIRTVDLNSSSGPNIRIDGLKKYRGSITHPEYLTLGEFKKYEEMIWYETPNSLKIEFGILTGRTNTGQKIPDPFKSQIKYLFAEITASPEGTYIEPVRIGSDIPDKHFMGDNTNQWDIYHSVDNTLCWSNELSDLANDSEVKTSKLSP